MDKNIYNKERIAKAGLQFIYKTKLEEQQNYTCLDHVNGIFSGFDIIKNEAIKIFIKNNPYIEDQIKYFNINENSKIFLSRYLDFHINEILRHYEITKEYLQKQSNIDKKYIRENMSIYFNEKIISSLIIMKIISYEIFLIMIDIVDKVENEIEVKKLKEQEEIEKNRTLCEKFEIWFKSVIK